jgi:eukaryotic-like serine/threonine-protein kinase
MDTSTDRGPGPAMAPQGATPRLAAGAVLGGRFTIVDFLGRSAFAELFRATDATDGKSVVIKLLHRDLLRDAGIRARLEQEISIASQLDHKNISKTFGFWVEKDQPYIAAEDIDGSTLRDMLEKKRAQGRAFSLKGAYNVMAHVCNALAYAHGATVHGALSTSAILVNAAGRVKVTDFGIARSLPALDHFGAQLRPGASGVGAMPPEMAAAPDTVDKRADIYSIGAILFELLTGRAPSETFERPSAVVPGLPASLDPVVEKCLRALPPERYGDAQELKHALHVALESYVTGGTPAAVSAVPTPAPAQKSAPVAARPAAAPPPRPPAAPPAAAAPRPAPAPAAAPRPAPQVARAPIAPSFNLDSALSAVDESQERWLIQKDRLDFGPFRLGDVKIQIEKGQILGEHTIVDMENGERRRVKDHPLLREFVMRTEGQREENRRQEADAAEARASKRKVVTLLAIIAVVLVVGGGGVAAYVVTRPPKETTKVIYKDREGDDLLKGIEITMKVDPPAPKTKKGHHGKHGGGNGEFSDVTNLGDASDEGGGDETLGQDVVQRVMSSNFGVLKGCVLEEKRRNPGLHNVDMDFIIRGTGQVSAVKVNGNTESPVSKCMYAKMQSVAFPKFNGSKTHASFSLALK